MPRILGLFVVTLAAMGAIVAAQTTALAQTRPAVTGLGPDFAKTGIFIGNSFFYYNNGLPGHLSLMEKAADPDRKQDYRNTMVTIGAPGFDFPDVQLYFPPHPLAHYSFHDTHNPA